MTIADTIDLDSEQALRQLCHRKYLLTNQDSLTSTQLGKDALILFLLKLNRSYLKVGYQYPDLLPISGCSTFMRDIISLHLQISPSKKKALSEFEMLRISANDCILWQRPNKLQGKIAALYQECRNMETSDMRSKY